MRQNVAFNELTEIQISYCKVGWSRQGLRQHRKRLPLTPDNHFTQHDKTELNIIYIMRHKHKTLFVCHNA